MVVQTCQFTKALLNYTLKMVIVTHTFCLNTAVKGTKQIGNRKGPLRGPSFSKLLRPGKERPRGCWQEGDQDPACPFWNLALAETHGEEGCADPPF